MSEWIHPLDMPPWLTAAYRSHYKAGHSSYIAHYQAAIASGNHISVDRMEKTLELYTIGRLKGRKPLPLLT